MPFSSHPGARGWYNLLLIHVNGASREGLTWRKHGGKLCGVRPPLCLFARSRVRPKSLDLLRTDAPPVRLACDDLHEVVLLFELEALLAGFDVRPVAEPRLHRTRKLKLFARALREGEGAVEDRLEELLWFVVVLGEGWRRVALLVLFKLAPDYLGRSPRCEVCEMEWWNWEMARVEF